MRSPLTASTACVALLIASSLARAQGVAPSPAPDLTPALYEQGNLRVAVRCAESFETPEQGLRVSLDGAGPLPPLRVNGEQWLGTDARGHLMTGWSATDVGYVAPPGLHRVHVDAPDCIPEDRDVVVSATHAERVDGRLAVARAALDGPVGAPDGFGLVLGGFTAPYPESIRSGVDSMGMSPTAYSIDPTSAQGVWLASTFERRYFALALDTTLGAGQLGGNVRSPADTPPAPGGSPGPSPFTGSFLETGLALRVGARLPLRYAALAAGSGIGGSLWLVNQATVASGGASPGQTSAMAVQGVHAAWDVPLWAAVTVKPFCGLGVQALASYDAEPSQSWHGGVMLGVGLMFQPSAACSESAGLGVRP
jgi:hypothetical protein